MQYSRLNANNANNANNKNERLRYYVIDSVGSQSEAFEGFGDELIRQITKTSTNELLSCLLVFSSKGVFLLSLSNLYH